MPRCEGRPEGACPDQRIDDTVKRTQGDLMLCPECDKYRFPACYSAGSNLRSAKTKNVKQSSARDKSKDETAVKSIIRTESTSSHSTVGRPDAVSNQSKEILINEVLAYISFFRNKGNHENLQNIVRTFFSSSDITDAKKLLTDEFASYLGASPVLTERRTTSTRAAHEAELDDIFGAFDFLDIQNALNNCHFVALKLDSLPTHGPEGTINGCTTETQTQLECQINKLAGDICQLQQKMENFDTSVNHQLNVLNTNLSADKVPVRQSTNTTRDVDRSMNVIVFGVQENRNTEIWRNKIDDVLQFISGREVDVVDMFRIGRYMNGKCRPVLVKLRTVWDRRVLVSRCSKLKDYPDRIFVSPDESPEARRKRVFERIKVKAELDGKSVNVVSDVLYVDGIGRYSLKDGAIHNDVS